MAGSGTLELVTGGEGGPLGTLWRRCEDTRVGDAAAHKELTFLDLPAVALEPDPVFCMFDPDRSWVEFCVGAFCGVEVEWDDEKKSKLKGRVRTVKTKRCEWFPGFLMGEIPLYLCMYRLCKYSCK